MQKDPHALNIHVDGSAYRNPGHSGGIAAIVEYPDSFDRESEIIFELGFEATTNNRMELHACIKALEWARNNAKLLGVPRVVIITDSLYVYENQHNAPNWKKDKWRNRYDRPVDNSDLWDELIFLRAKIGLRIDIEWHRGKSTDLGKSVDKVAKRSAQTNVKNADSGYHSGKISRTKLPGIAAEMFPANGQEEIIRIYRKDYHYRTKQKECKISFEVYSESTNTYVSKNFAYTSPENELELHRSHLYRVHFNDNPKYPIIVAILEEFKLGSVQS